MKGTIAGLLMLTLLLAACAEPTPRAPVYETNVHLQAEYQVPSEVEGVRSLFTNMRYLIYLPNGYGDDPHKEWPLIFFLHGSGSGINDSAFVLSYGLPEVLVSGDQPDNFEFIVVSPQAFPGITWWEGNQIPVMNHLLDEVIETYQVDTHRMYLTGLSMGGYGSWFMAMYYPQRFAAMVSISGSGYRVASLPPKDQFCQLADVPVWGIHGANDQISEPSLSEWVVQALREVCGGDVKFTMYPDDNHFTTYAKAYRDPALYEWMLQHSR